MDQHLNKILGLIDIFGPISKKDKRFNVADFNALLKLGYVKKTFSGWAITKNGKKVLDA